MNRAATYLNIFIVACVPSACSSEQAAFDPAIYEAEIAEWRAGRLERLKGPTGFLNLVGLFWLETESSRIGSGANNDIVFPAAAAASVGVLRTSDDGVMLDVEPGVDVRHGNEAVTSILIADDTTEDPVTVTHGTLAWTIIKRDGRYALRLRDYAHPAIASFPPIESYPIDPSFRVEAELRPFAEPKIMDVNTTIEGIGYHPRSPGKLAFEFEGATYELEAYESGNELFLVFADLTSGRETYPAGRFLYAAAPDESGKTVLDFNRAYNPPCAFNDFATCPVASPRNRLAVRIEAGEKFDPKVHVPVNKSY